MRRFVLCFFCIFFLSVTSIAADFESGELPVPEIVVIDNGTDLSGIESQLDSVSDGLLSLSEGLEAVLDSVSSFDVSAVLDTQASSFTADTALGTLEFILPAGTVSNPFIVLSSGSVINGTASTLYLYSPRFPGYTFQASRFAGFQYRTNSTSQNPWYDLNLRNVELSSVPSGSGFLEYAPVVFLAWLCFCSIPSLVNAFRRFNA